MENSIVDDGEAQRIMALRYSMEHQSPIVMAYAYGTREGQERVLTVIGSTDDTWSGFYAKEPNGDNRIYVTSRILWIVEADGTRLENQDRMQGYAAFQEARTLEQEQLSRLFQETGNAKEQLASLKNNPESPLNSHQSMRLTGKNGQSISVSFRSDFQQDRIEGALNYLIERTGGWVWRVVGIFLEAGFWVPAWCKYAQTLRLEGAVLRGATVRLRDSTAKCDNICHYHYLDANPQYAIYNRSRMRPPEEDEDSMIDRIRLFESEDLNFPDDLFCFKGLPAKALGVYVTLCTRGALAQCPSSEIDEVTLNALLECGLMKRLADLPIQTLILNMRATELYAPIKKRNIKLAKRGLLEYYAYYNVNLDAEHEQELRASPWLNDQYLFVPPENWSWNKFLDLRTSYIAMLKIIVCWLNGQSVGVGEKAYFLKG